MWDGCDAITEYQRSGLIEYAEPDYLFTYTAVSPNDPKYADNTLWNLNNIGQDADIDAPEAWQFRTDGQSVIVAVIDTGVNYRHPDLALNMWTNPNEVSDSMDNDGSGYIDDIYGINAFEGTGDPDDIEDHGSHVAGIVGAVGNNNVGVVGVAWRVRIMALSHEGSTAESDAIECIDYAIAKGVHVINGSFAFPSFSQALLDVIRTAGNHGIIGSSRNSGKGLSDFEEEVLLITKAVSHSFDDFDFVIDAFQHAGVQGPATMGQDSMESVF